MGGGSVTVYAKENADTKKRNAALRERKALKNKEGAESSHEKTEKGHSKEGVHRKTFTWEAINYVVPVPGGSRRLLHDVYGYVKPGTLVRISLCYTFHHLLTCLTQDCTHGCFGSW